MIVDERFNAGGSVADYYIDILRRPFIANWAMRYGADLKTPFASIQGPKAMIIDETAGSGGDLLPWMFRKYKMGPLVGQRTWGGLVGILGFPVLMDGGTITAPNLAIWTPEDGWVVENEGVAPDIEVEQTPADVIAGRDPAARKGDRGRAGRAQEEPSREDRPAGLSGQGQDAAGHRSGRRPMRTIFEQLAQDLRYGVRGLRRSRAFLMTTVLTLAVGVGLLAVAFTVVNAYVLRPYAVRDPQQLHQVGWRSRDDGGQSFRWREYQELRQRSDVFEAAVAESTRFISSNGRPLAAALVSDNYFEALGPAVFMGRTWRGDERDVEGVVLSHQGWMRLFVSDRRRHHPARAGYQRPAVSRARDPAPGVHGPERFAARRLDSVHHLLAAR